MRLLLRSLKPMEYRSRVRCEAASIPGVSYSLNRMSLGRRIELAESIRDLAVALEYSRAGETAREQVEAAVLSAKIDQAYLRWGLAGVSGLLIDGQPPTADTLFERGPEDLLREIVDRIKCECGLTDDERKN
ncbi:MAG: hypothetical protein JSU00_07455 [Acidobacteria bacterium]|nr:hypothetical protein [Acidobacteriota bacterium]